MLHNLAMNNVSNPDHGQDTIVEEVITPVPPVEKKADTERDLLIRGNAVRRQLVKRLNNI